MAGTTKSDYAEIARQSRLKTLELIYKAQTSHIGSNFSVADIMAVLFEHVNLDKDKVILSAGWKAAMLYYHLWRKGRIKKSELESYCQPDSKWIGLAEPIHPDIPFAGGSMGMGLAAGVAIAWSKKQRSEEGTVYVIESDGGMQCGSTYEALSFAYHHKLTNIILIVDSNGHQAMGVTDSINRQKIDRVLYGFGWIVAKEEDGHSYMGLDWDIGSKRDLQLTSERLQRPAALVAKTIKGKGVSFMENNNLYHYKQLSEEEYLKAKTELHG